MNNFTKIFLAAVLVAYLASRWAAPVFNEESLRGARVLVTGASTGIGEQMAYHYARFGAEIVITARREKVLQQVADKCVSLGAQKALYVAADMSSDSDPDHVVEFALDRLGGLDFLVLNHIGSSPFSMWEGDLEHTRWLMKVNFHSYVQMAWKSLPWLERSRGSLVVVSSLLGKLSSPFVAPYTSTKFALNGFFGSLGHELWMRRSNVSVSIVTLGLIDTDSAMEKVRGVTNVPAYPASDAALAIIVTGATRAPQTFYPWFTSVVAVCKELFPAVTDYFVRNSYNYTHDP